MGGYALQLSDAELRRYQLMSEAARRDEADLWDLARIVPGATVADVGCGPGAMLTALSQAVGPAGQVVGVDGNPDACAAAQALVDAAGLTNTTVQVGQADDTGLEPSAFDVVMMRHVLAHNGDREQSIVDHLGRLVRPGGTVYLLDVYGEAIALRNLDPELEDLQAKYQEFHARRGNDLRVGLRLDELLEAAGLEVISYRGWFSILTPPPGVRPPPWAAREAMVAAGVASVADVERWNAAFERSDAVQAAGGTARVTVFAPQFVAIGRRPT